MNAATLQRYAPGGDIHDRLSQRYGDAMASRAYELAEAGDPDALNLFLSNLRQGYPPNRGDLNESVSDAFLDQLATDPLGAPLDSANRQLGNVAFGLLRNPWVALALAVLVLIQFPAVRKAVFGK